MTTPEDPQFIVSARGTRHRVTWTNPSYIAAFCGTGGTLRARLVGAVIEHKRDCLRCFPPPPKGETPIPPGLNGTD